MNQLKPFRSTRVSLRSQRQWPAALWLASLALLLTPNVTLAGEPVALSSSEVSSEIEDLLSDTQAAKGFDYCSWRFDSSGAADDLPNFDAMLDAGADQPEGRQLEAVILTAAGTKIGLAAADEAGCRRSFDQGSKTDAKRYEKALKKISGRAKKKLSRDAKIAAVQERVTMLWVEDQAARQAYIESQTEDETGAAYWAQRLAAARASSADDRSTSALRELVAEYDWIDSHRFGKGIDQHAWILVQHADDYPEFQSDVLARMEKYVETGGVRKQDYAYLWDRVAVNHGRKQRYGTQPDWECRENGLTLRPMEEPDRVDELRKTMGLGPVQDALAEMSRSVCGK